MTPSLKKAFFAAAAVMVSLAGCAAIGPTDNPVLRSLTWERYVGGDDLDRACTAGQPPRYRLVYGAVEQEQRRTYDITGEPDGEAMLEARVVGRPVLNDPRNPITLRDPLAPWRGQFSLYRLNARELDGIVAALRTSGFEQPAPDGLFLRGDSFYWTASTCRDGRFHFYAWSAEQPGFAAVTDRLLAALQPFDTTGVAAIRPHEVALPPYSSYFSGGPVDSSKYIPNRYQVGRNGLRYAQGTLN